MSHFATSTHRTNWLLNYEGHIERNTKILRTVLGDSSHSTSGPPTAEELEIIRQDRIIVANFCESIQGVVSSGSTNKPAFVRHWRVQATAIVYFQRFYAVNSLLSYDPRHIVLACIFLASKSEEGFLRPKDIVETIKSANCSVEQLLANEITLLEALKFDLKVFHPLNLVDGLGDQIVQAGAALNAEMGTPAGATEVENKAGNLPKTLDLAKCTSESNLSAMGGAAATESTAMEIESAAAKIAVSGVAGAGTAVVPVTHEGSSAMDLAESKEAPVSLSVGIAGTKVIAVESKAGASLSNKTTGSFALPAGAKRKWVDLAKQRLQQLKTTSICLYFSPGIISLFALQHAAMAMITPAHALGNAVPLHGSATTHTVGHVLKRYIENWVSQHENAEVLRGSLDGAGRWNEQNTSIFAGVDKAMTKQYLARMKAQSTWNAVGNNVSASATTK